VEVQEYRAAKMRGKMVMSGKEFWVTEGTTISYSAFLLEGLTDDSYCNYRVLEMPGGHKIGSQATWTVKNITILEERTKINNFRGVIMVAPGSQPRLLT
jgi:hypothetical protein